jgi:two-component system phosphate regulon sensor histidine kinase PhoR
MTRKIFVKMLGWVIVLMLLALVMVDFLANDVAEENYIQNLTAQLADKGRMIALVPPGPEHFDAAIARSLAAAAHCRVTVVRNDGKVLVDSEADASTMENHRNPNRPELMEAFSDRVGTNQRMSATVGVRFLYVAVPVNHGAVAVRLAVTLQAIDAQINQLRGKLLAATGLAFLAPFCQCHVACRRTGARQFPVAPRRPGRQRVRQPWGHAQ